MEYLKIYVLGISFSDTAGMEEQWSYCEFIFILLVDKVAGFVEPCKIWHEQSIQWLFLCFYQISLWSLTSYRAL